MDVNFTEVPTGGQLPAGIPASGDVPETEETCGLFGGSYRIQSGRGRCDFTDDDENREGFCFHAISCGSGNNFEVYNLIRDCNLQNKPAIGPGYLRDCAANECPEGSIAVGTQCTTERSIDRLVRLVQNDNGVLSAATAEGGAVANGALLADGAEIVFTATPNAGYYVTGWSGCETNAQTGGHADGGAKTCEETLSADLRVQATFALRHRAVNFSAGDNGAVSAARGGVPLSTGERVAPGARIVFTATPDAGYYVSAWTGCENGELGGAGNGDAKQCEATAESDITLLNRDLNVRPTFAPLGWTASATQSEGGAVSVDIQTPTALGRAAHNSQVVFTATPEAGNFVHSWTGDCLGNENVGSPSDEQAEAKECAVSADRDVSAGALYRPLSPQVGVSEADNGRTDAASGELAWTEGETRSVPNGMTVTFTASPDSGYYVSGWQNCPGGETGDVIDGAAKECERVATDEFSANGIFSALAAGQLTVGIPAFGEIPENRANCELFGGEYVAGEFVRQPDGSRQYRPTACNNLVGSAGCQFSFQACTAALTNIRNCNLNNLRANAETLRSANVCGALCTAGAIAYVDECRGGVRQKIEYSQPSNGALSAALEGENVASGDLILRDSRVIFTATPDTGYYVSGWTGCSGNLGSATDGGAKTCTLPVALDANVGVVFTQNPDLAMSAELGKASPNVEVVRALLVDQASPDGSASDPLIFRLARDGRSSQLRADLISLLITAGANPDIRAQTFAGRTGGLAHLLAERARVAGTDALLKLKRFIAADNLTSTGAHNWSTTGANFNTGGDNVNPLEQLNIVCAQGTSTLSEECIAMALLMRAAGASCGADIANSVICGTLDETGTRPAYSGSVEGEAVDGEFSGPLLTVSAPENVHGIEFRVSVENLSSASAALSASGWAIAENNSANPRIVVLSRLTTSPVTDGEAAAVPAFTVRVHSGGLTLRKAEVAVTARAVSQNSREIFAEVVRANGRANYVASRLNLGVSPNALLQSGQPILVAAGLAGNTEIVRLLLEDPHSANSNITDPTSGGRDLPQIITNNPETLNLPWTTVRNVLSVFAQSAPATHNWNPADPGGRSPLDSLAAAHALAGANDQAVITQAAEHILSRGGECILPANASNPFCVGDPRRVSFAHIGNGAIAASSGDSVVNSGDSLTHGTLVTLTATPDDNHYVAEWTGACASAERGGVDNIAAKTCAVTLFADISVGVEFRQRLRRIDLSDSTRFGVLTAESGGVDVAGGYVPHGALVTFTATPDRIDENLYYVRFWRTTTGQAIPAECQTGDASDTTAKTCVLPATANIRMIVNFQNIEVPQAELNAQLSMEIFRDPFDIERAGLLLVLGADKEQRNANDESLLIQAARASRELAVSVLITAGADPEARTAAHPTRQVPHWASRGLDLELMRHFIGGIGAVNHSYNWDTTSDRGVFTPLGMLQNYHGQNLSEGARELAALVYERGGRCGGQTGAHCDLPTETQNRVIADDAQGDVLTIIARDFAGAQFDLSLPDSDSLAALTAEGWALRLETERPQKIILTRGQTHRMVAAVFTITARNAGTEVRNYMISARLSGAEDDPESALTTELAKTVSEISAARVSALLDQGATLPETPAGAVPLVVAAAEIGNGDLASVIITAGADPTETDPDTGRNAMHIVAINGVFAGGDAPANPWVDADTSPGNFVQKFLNALAITGGAFDWNATDNDGKRALDYSAERFLFYEFLSDQRRGILIAADLMRREGGAECSPAIAADSANQRTCLGVFSSP